MKKIFIVALGLSVMFMFSCNCDKPKPPKDVLTTFNQMFPTASDVEWELEDENEWEAEFEMDGKEIEAGFDHSGKWLETEWKVDITEIPGAILTMIGANYEGWEIKETEFVESPDIVGYEVKLKMGDKQIELQINSNGEILAMELDDDEDK